MDFTKANLEKALAAKLPNLSECIRKANTDHHGIRLQSTDKKRLVEKIQRHIYVSKQTIDKLKKENKILKFEVRIKEKRMAIAEQALREKFVTIEILKTQLREKNEEHKKDKAESNQENSPRGIPPELKYDERDTNCLLYTSDAADE